MKHTYRVKILLQMQRFLWDLADFHPAPEAYHSSYPDRASAAEQPHFSSRQCSNLKQITFDGSQ